MPCVAAGRQRGCGVRTKGGVYVETHVGAGGLPLEAFLLDPPVPLTFTLSANGQTIRPGPDDVPMVYDWVGVGSYPNVADFVEEMRQAGMSRKVSQGFASTELRTLDRARSRWLLVHPRAYIRNADAYYLDGALESLRCLRAVKGLAHDPVLPDAVALARAKADPDWALPMPMCSGLWWQDVDGGAPATLFDADPGDGSFDPRATIRSVGETTYRARSRPNGARPDYLPAVFAAMPIGNVAVINDPDDAARVADLYGKISAILAGLPVFLEDQ